MGDRQSLFNTNTTGGDSRRSASAAGSARSPIRISGTGITITVGALAFLLVAAIAITGLVVASVAKGQIDSKLHPKLTRIGDRTSGLSDSATIHGSHPTQDDINVIHSAYIGRSLFVNNTAVIGDGIEVQSGGGSFNSSVTLYHGDLVVSRGSVTAECVSEVQNFTVASSADDVVRGDVIGIINGVAYPGFSNFHDVSVASTVGTQSRNLQTISLSSTRVVNFFYDASNYLVFQVVTLNEQTLEPTVYNTVQLAGGVAFTDNFPFYAIPYDGDASRFLVAYTEPAGNNDYYLIQGVTITDLTYPTVTATASSATANQISPQLTNICGGPLGFLYTGGTTYYATYTDTTAIRVKAFTAVVSGTSWTFTFGTVQSISTAVAAADMCFVASGAVVSRTTTTAYVAFTYGGGDSTANIATNGFSVTGTTWTAGSGTAVTLLTSVTAGARHYSVPLAGDAQYLVVIQAQSDQVPGAAYAINFNTGTLVVTRVDSTYATIDFNPWQGYFNSFLSTPATQVISMNGASSAQDVVICYQGPLEVGSKVFCNVYTLNAGVYDTATQPVAITAYAPSSTTLGSPGYMNIGYINDTAFSFVWTASADGSLAPLRFGVVSLDDAGQPMVSRLYPEFPIGIATNNATAGETVTVLLRGCMTDTTLFPYTTAVKLCLHGDGNIMPTNYHIRGVSATYEPVCSCGHTADGVIHCDYAFLQAAENPFYNTQ